MVAAMADVQQNAKKAANTIEVICRVNLAGILQIFMYATLNKYYFYKLTAKPKVNETDPDDLSYIICAK